MWSVLSLGQKPTLNLESYKNWPEVGGGGLSPNGHYAYYNVKNIFYEGIGYFKSKSTFYLKTTSGKELYAVNNLTSPKFSENDKFFYGKLPGDSLLIYDLASKRNITLLNVTGYELVNVGDDERLLLKAGETLKLCDLTGNQLQVFEGIRQYRFSNSGKVMFFVKQDAVKKDKVSAWLADLQTGKQQQVYEGPNIGDIIFSREDSQLAFIAETSKTNSIWYYKLGTKKAILLTNQGTTGIPSGYAIVPGAYWSFSKDGKSIFFSVKEPEISPRKAETAEVEIWSYQDAYLNSFYNGMVGKSMLQDRSYLSILNISAGTARQLISGNEKVVPGTLNYDTDSICIVESSGALNTEYWNKNARQSFYICRTATAEMLPFEVGKTGGIAPSISPRGKFIVYFDSDIKNYICYDIAVKTKRNISKGINSSFAAYDKLHYPNAENAYLGIAGWYKDDTALLINTTFDIYKLDPSGLTGPVSLTKGIGDKEKIVFYLAGQPTGSIIENEKKVLLSAFNTRTKNYGFYLCTVDRSVSSIKELYSAPRYAGRLNNVYYQLKDEDFITALGKGGYLLRWEQANRSPNYYFSPDLIQYNPISEVTPEVNYNWITSELHAYKDSAGNTYQGVLYKPENFDPNRKYPVIFNIYETQSNGLNAFIHPGLTSANFNLPLLVSNGYLVFLPDMRGIVGAPGEGALRSILAATNHITKYPFVDSSKMALVGHSFGGFETNYIITHCSKFAAAISGSGVSDMTRLATAIWFPGQSQQYFTQYSYFMMGKPLVDDLPSYIRNSPLFDAKQLNTPSLFMHNDGDENVNFTQTQAFFLLLRSLSKPCWWLNYKGQGHGVGGEKNQSDYNTKVWQFLDHYLKGKPMPDWMKEHI